MSSSPSRDPLPGVIRQNTRVIGPILLPEKDLEKFIDQFNNCYGPLRMHIDPASYTLAPRAELFPVGASRPSAHALSPPKLESSDS